MWLDWRIAVLMAGALCAAAFVYRPVLPRGITTRACMVEAAVVLTLYATWHWIGRVTVTQTDGALRNATTIWEWERWLRLPSEAAWNQALLAHPWLVQAANLFYAVVHVPALIVFLVWMFLRHRDQYPAARNTVALATLGCLLIQLVPVAPPRMLANLGFVDTALRYGQSVYGSMGLSADQVAAMPSLHVGWAVLIAGFVIAASTSKWRWWILAHPILTTVVVVVTANHWWLDGVVAVVVVAGAEALRRAAALASARLRRLAVAPAA